MRASQQTIPIQDYGLVGWDSIRGRHMTGQENRPGSNLPRGLVDHPTTLLSRPFALALFCCVAMVLCLLALTLATSGPEANGTCTPGSRTLNRTVASEQVRDPDVQFGLARTTSPPAVIDMHPRSEPLSVPEGSACSPREIVIENGDIHPDASPSGALCSRSCRRTIATGKGPISGRILYEQGYPAAGVQVLLHYGGRWLVGTRVSDPEGHFAFVAVVFGCSEDSSGSRTRIDYGIGIRAPAYEWFDSSPITSPDVTIEIVLKPEGVISGVVVLQESDAAVPFAWMCLRGAVGEGTVSLRTERTDSEGRFTFVGPHLDSGPWRGSRLTTAISNR
jgi:hypothetical protein